MTVLATDRYLYEGQVGFRKEITVAFKVLAQSIGGVLALNANRDGIIPPGSNQQKRALADVGDLTERFFVGVDYRHAYGAEGRPLSPYANVLNKWLIWTQAQVIDSHARFLQRRLPADVLQWLNTARPPAPARELLIVGDRAFVEYEAAHTWIDPNGYSLSDRIWRTGIATRTKIDQILTQGIRDGLSAVELSQQLEQYLQPGRIAVRTTKPYGANLSYDAMRLARSEITRAHSEASLVAARQNPFVGGWDWALSASHPKVDICDQLATIGMGGQRLKDPYPIEGDCPIPVQNSHPHCVTPGQMIKTLFGDKPIEEVVAGDFVLTHENRYCRVLKSWSRQYNGLVHKIKTTEGEFELTSEHPVLTARGWVDADSVQPGDQIIYTSSNISVDSFLGVSEGEPSHLQELFISDSIPFSVVPTSTVALNGYFEFDKGKIKSVSEDGILLNVEDIAPVQFSSHIQFERANAPVIGITGTGAEYLCVLIGEKAFPTIQARAFLSHQHGLADPHLFNHIPIMHGIIDPLISRNLCSGDETFSGIIVSNHIPQAIDFFEYQRGFGAACAIISHPLSFDSFMTIFHGDTTIFQETSQLSELNTQYGTDFGTSEGLTNVEFIQQICKRAIEFIFEALNVMQRNSLRSACNAVFTSAWLAAKQAIIHGWHDNLLSLSPDDVMGADSGKSVVSEVANLTQAHINYSTVLSIETQEYEGLVYNMHVDVDNTYTVNGAVVHNCICTGRPADFQPTAEVVADLRESMGQGEPAPMTPANRDGFLRVLLGIYLFSQTDQFTGAA